MKIKQVEYLHLQIPLKQPFQTSSSLLTVRDIGLLVFHDEVGNTGYGEVSSFLTPWYTSETLISDEYVVLNMLPTLLKNKTIVHPSECRTLLAPIEGHSMLKAAIEAATWDLYGKQKEQSLSQLLGSICDEVPVGIAIGAHQNIEKTKEEIHHYMQQGYKRFKLKIIKGKERKILDEIRNEFQEIPLMFDANGCYDKKDIRMLQSLDEYNLLMIEQPFARNEWYLSSELQKNIQTRVCLDESIESLFDCQLGVDLKAFRMANMKYSRVGGISNAIDFTKYLKANHVESWVGGMIETGISKAVTLTIASLPYFVIPGDITASDRFFERDIITNPFTISNGVIKVQKKYGIGIEVDEEAVQFYSIKKTKVW